MKRAWLIQISILMLLVATLFSTGITFGDTGNQPSTDFQENHQKRGFIGRIALQERLNDAVAEGKITVEEAAERIAKFEDVVENGGKFGKGQRRNFNQNSDVQNNNADSEVYQTV